MLVPAVAALGVDSGMAGLAQGNEIVSRVGSAFSQRLLVVDLFSGGQPAFLLAQLAQRVLLDVPVADALPGAAIMS